MIVKTDCETDGSFYSTSYKSVAVSPSDQSESDSTMNTSTEAGGEAGLLGLYTHYLVELRDPR